MPISLKACPYLALCIAFDFRNFVFRAFVFIFSFSERAFAIATKVPLAPIVLAFWEKEGKPWGFLRWVRTDVACVFIREYVGFLEAPQS